jgi:hypothetical protein
METLKALGAVAGIGGIGIGAAVLIFRERPLVDIVLINTKEIIIGSLLKNLQ